MTDKLESLFDQQKELMALLRVPVAASEDAFFLNEELLTFSISTAAFALQIEIAEMLQELNWKPWKKTIKQVNVEKVKEEMVDCLHFVLQMLIIMGADAEETHRLYWRKMQENIKRQERGY